MTGSEIILLLAGNAVTLAGLGLAFRVRLEARLVRLETLVTLIGKRLGIHHADNNASG